MKTRGIIICIMLLVSVLIAGCEWLVPQEDITKNVTNQTIIVIEEEGISVTPLPDIITTTTLKEGEGGLKTEFIEGDLISFANLEATDPDGDPVEFIYGLPLNEEGEWLTKVGDAGTYVLNITATDGKAFSAPFQIEIVVEPLNAKPVIEEIDDVIITEGELIDLAPLVKVDDADGDEITVEYSGWMSSAKYQTTFDDAGIHTVTVTASDSMDSVSTDVKINVKNKNRAPEIDEITYDIIVEEGELVEVEISAADPDGDELVITFEEPLDKDGKWQTEDGDDGEYDPKISVSDGSLKDTITVKIIVNAINKKPVFAVIKDVVVNEGKIAYIDAEAEDPEGEEVTITFEEPFDEDGIWETDFDDAGVYDIEVTASDGVNKATETVKVTIKNVNRAPVIKSIEDVELIEGEIITVVAKATDSDGDDIVITYGAPLDDAGEWKTKEGDANDYEVTITASDGEDEAELTFLLTVNPLNNAPVLDKLDDIIAEEGDKITIAATATDADDDDLTFTFTEPFDENGQWQTDYDDEGDFEVTVTVSDDISEDSQTIIVVVENVNRPPCIVGINC